jgi:hypothetical protein
MPLLAGDIVVSQVDGTATGTGLSFAIYEEIAEDFINDLPLDLEGDPLKVPTAEGWAMVLVDYAEGIVKHFVENSDTSTIPVTFTQKVTLQGEGRIKYRVRPATDTNLDISVLEHDYVFTPASTLTAPRIWTIQDSGAEDGMVLKLSRRADVSPNTVTVTRSGLPDITLSTFGTPSCELLRVSGLWQQF